MHVIYTHRYTGTHTTQTQLHCKLRLWCNVAPSSRRRRRRRRANRTEALSHFGFSVQRTRTHAGGCHIYRHESRATTGQPVRAQVRRPFIHSSRVALSSICNCREACAHRRQCCVYACAPDASAIMARGARVTGALCVCVCVLLL